MYIYSPLLASIPDYFRKEKNEWQRDFTLHLANAINAKNTGGTIDIIVSEP